MAGGILVEQRVAEQQPALRDRRGIATSATSPSRRAPSSVSSTFASTSSPRVARASTMRPASKRTAMPSIRVP
jgi:hypothetical protein